MARVGMIARLARAVVGAERAHRVVFEEAAARPALRTRIDAVLAVRIVARVQPRVVARILVPAR
jgi:hypothetical protein